MAFEEVTAQAQQALETPQPDNQVTEPGQSLQTEQGDPSQQPAPAETIADLAKLNKFKLDGKEYTYDQLKQERMRAQDYTRKTQELSDQRRQFQQEAKFATNYRSDLKTVRTKPWMASEFYKLYPSEYHDEVKWIEQTYKSNPGLWSTSGQPAQGQAPQSAKQEQPNVEELVERLVSNRLKPLEEREKRDQERAILAEMDSRESKLMSKYPNANKFEVYAAAEFLAKADDINPEGRELTDDDWEKVFKDSNERTLTSFKSWQAQAFNKQTQTSQKLKDVQGGGGIPGEAPVVAKNLKEAKAQFEKLMGVS